MVDKLNRAGQTPNVTNKPAKKAGAIASAGMKINSVMQNKAKAKESKDVTFGGIKFNKTDVKSLEASQCSVQAGGNKEAPYSDATKYDVELKDGTKMTWNSHTYEDGSSTEKANLTDKAEVIIEKNGTVNFKGLNGVTIEDTPKDDNYRLLGCSFTKVKASRTEQDELGTVDKFKRQIGLPVEATYHGKDKDNITVANRELPNHKIQKSANNLVSTNNGDKVNGKETESELNTKYGIGETN